jgi:glycosyltransferase involved in cell wall biosynthesis
MSTADGALRIVHGTLRDARANAFAVVKDEQFYIRSFLDHHRRLGMEQFVIIDDQSTDGTRELLAAQPDCVVLESPHRYGEEIGLAGATGERRLRAGIAFKTLLPRQYLAGHYAVCLDADEYLVLPEGVASIGELIELLTRHDVASVAATLVDFFPATLAEMEQPREFPTAEAMLGAHPYFDAVPIVGWTPGKTGVQRINESATARLFRKHRVRKVPDFMAGAPRWLNRVLPYRYPETSVLKTPVVRWDRGVEYLNSHRTNVPPSDRVLVGLAHLKFTHDLARRIDYAIRSRAYVRGSRKYQWYVELLEAMRAGDGSFLGADSRRYRSPADLAAAGLTRLALDRP